MEHGSGIYVRGLFPLVPLFSLIVFWFGLWLMSFSLITIDCITRTDASWLQVINTGVQIPHTAAQHTQVDLCPDTCRVNSIYYRPQRSCGQGNVFTGVCHSFCSQGGLRRTPPRAGRPPQTRKNPPGTRENPPGRENPPQTRENPPGTRENPPGTRQTPPREEDCSIRFMSGRYASYWNAFLFHILWSCWLLSLVLHVVRAFRGEIVQCRIYIVKFRSNFLHFHAIFKKIWSNNRLTPPLGLTLPGKSWIRLCNCTCKTTIELYRQSREITGHIMTLISSLGSRPSEVNLLLWLLNITTTGH